MIQAFLKGQDNTNVSRNNKRRKCINKLNE